MGKQQDYTAKVEGTFINAPVDLGGAKDVVDTWAKSLTNPAVITLDDIPPETKVLKVTAGGIPVEIILASGTVPCQWSSPAGSSEVAAASPEGKQGASPSEKQGASSSGMPGASSSDKQGVSSSEQQGASSSGTPGASSSEKQGASPSEKQAASPSGKERAEVSRGSGMSCLHVAALLAALWQRWR